MQQMKTSKSYYYWFALFAICFIAYQQVQDNIRPQYTGGNSTIKYLLGIAPNFFPSIGIPALFVVLLPQMKLASKWLNEKKYIPYKFSWQDGFGAFTYSKSHIDKVVKYVLNQPIHHRKKTFKDEYLLILQKFGVDYDPKYVFEWYE